MDADPPATEPAATPPGPLPERRSPLSRVREAPRLAASIGGIAGAILTVLALFTWVFPGCERKADEPQANRGAELTVLRRDPNVRLGAHLRREGRPTDGLSPAALREAGNVFTLQFGLEGLQGRALPLRWTAFDADSDSALPGKVFNNRLEATIRPSRSVSEGEKGALRVWVPLPPRSGRFFVRFDLYDGEGGLLATVDGDPFPVTARR